MSGKRTVRMKDVVQCDECDGKGKVSHFTRMCTGSSLEEKVRCPKCNGYGRIVMNCNENKTTAIKLPPGTHVIDIYPPAGGAWEGIPIIHPD